MSFLHSLERLIGLGQPSQPQITQKPAQVFVKPDQYAGTYNGYGPQSLALPKVDPNQHQPAYSGGIDVTQQNTPGGEGVLNRFKTSIPNANLYNNPAPSPRPVTMPAFQPHAQHSVVNFPETPVASLPPRMVNVAWSPTPVPYSQSLKPPAGY